MFSVLLVLEYFVQPYAYLLEWVLYEISPTRAEIPTHALKHPATASRWFSSLGNRICWSLW
jgi:hypothetical protein